MRQWFQTRAQQDLEPQTRWRGGVWADTIRSDIRFGWRQMMRNPAFSLVAVATLALGIGANTAIFSVVNSILLKPLPFPDADRLVVPATIFSRQQSDRGSMSYPDLQDWRAQTDLFAAVAAINRTNADLTGGEEPERVRVLLVDQEYFTVMSARPARGRLFTAAEQVPQAPRAVILTWQMWMRRYGGDPGIVGRKIELSGAPAEVVGVLPAGAVWPEQVDLIASLRIGPNPTTADLTRRDNHMFRAVAKLQPGVNKVIIISQSMAREMFPNSDPLGRRIRSWRDENLYREIVGVVSDVHQYGLASSRQNNNVYVPHTQSPWRGMVLAIRSAGDPAALLPSIRSAIWLHDSRLPLAEVRTMPEVVERELARPRFAAWLLGVFAATALVMAAVGIYGLIAYTVSLRTREIGIRLALGATRGSVLALVGLRVLWLCAAGIAAGLTGAFLAGRALQSILNGVRPGDAVSFAGAAIVLAASIVVATWIPARRAARVDPVVALREE